MILSFIKKHYLIISILAIAFILRLVGILYGHPLALVNDETPTLAASLKMIGTSSLRANAFQYYYPAGLAYVFLPFLALYLVFARIFGIFGSIAEIKDIVLLNIGYFAPVARFVSVILGTASVFLVYHISQRLFSHKKISLLAAWFLAINFFHVANSHYGQTWTAQSFFILLVLFWAVYFYQKEKISRYDYPLAGIFIGLAFSINFVGIISYVWFLLAHWLKNKGQKFVKIFIANKNFWLANLVLLLMIALVYYLNPFGLNNYFGRIFNDNPATNSYSFFSFTSLKILFSYLKNGFLVEPLLFLLILPAALILWRKHKIAFCFLIPWLIIYLLFLAPLTNPMVRYLLPTIPLMSIVVAFFIHYLFEKFSAKIKIFIIIIFLLSLPSLFFSFLLDYRMTRQDTRLLAYSWVVNNIKSGSHIKNLDLGAEIPFVESKEIVSLVKEKLPELYSSKRKYLSSLEEENYPDPNYAIINYPDLVAADYDFEYLIVSDFDKNNLINKTKPTAASQKLIKHFYPSENSPLPIKSELELPFNLYSFNPWSLFHFYDYYGPYIEIYELKKTP